MIDPLISPLARDDVPLEGVAQQLAHAITFSSEGPLEGAAADEEWLRLAQETFEWAEQSIAVVVIQLEALSRVIDKGPAKAHKKLEKVQQIICNEQRKLRMLTRTLRDSGSVQRNRADSLQVSPVR